MSKKFVRGLEKEARFQLERSAYLERLKQNQQVDNAAIGKRSVPVPEKSRSKCRVPTGDVGNMRAGQQTNPRRSY